MVLSHMIRRASSVVAPFVTRAVKSPRSLRGAISAAVSVERQGSTSGTVASYLRFSTAVAGKDGSKEKLLKVFEGEIESAESEEDPHRDVLKDKPEEFPFEIQDTPGERTITLKREFDGEKIQIEVDTFTSVDDEDKDEDAGDDEDEGGEGKFCIPMVVQVTKGDGISLEFGISAYPEEIVIDSLSVKRPENSNEEIAYEGPEFEDLDEKLKEAFHSYLEVRGVKPSIISFLTEYMTNKDSREYIQWLKDLQSYVQM